MTDIALDFKGIRTRRGAHRYMARALKLPEYYGGNLDALIDCLGEMSDVNVTISNLKLGEYGKKILQVFLDRAEEGDGFTVTVSVPEKRDN